jgi:hypothetical protein
MTKQDLIDFCVENAGKMASGKHVRSREVKRGRIIAFTVDQYGRPLILLENANDVEKTDLPNPLPSIPYVMGNWFRVTSPAKMGDMCLAETVVLEEEASDHGACPVQPSAPPTQGTLKAIVEQGKATQAARRKCDHQECDPDWCHRKYAGI